MLPIGSLALYQPTNLIASHKNPAHIGVSVMVKNNKLAKVTIMREMKREGRRRNSHERMEKRNYSSVNSGCTLSNEQITSTCMETVKRRPHVIY